MILSRSPPARLTWPTLHLPWQPGPTEHLRTLGMSLSGKAESAPTLASTCRSALAEALYAPSIDNDLDVPAYDGLGSPPLGLHLRRSDTGAAHLPRWRSHRPGHGLGRVPGLRCQLHWPDVVGRLLPRSHRRSDHLQPGAVGQRDPGALRRAYTDACSRLGPRLSAGRSFRPGSFHWLMIHNAGEPSSSADGWGLGMGGDTWEYDGSTWWQITTTSAPSARGGHALAYDSSRRVVVLYGGSTESSDSDETWEYDGVNWVQKYSAGRPMPGLRRTWCTTTTVVLWCFSAATQLPLGGTMKPGNTTGQTGR